MRGFFKYSLPFRVCSVFARRVSSFAITTNSRKPARLWSSSSQTQDGLLQDQIRFATFTINGNDAPLPVGDE